MFAPLQNDTFLRACLRQATDHTPIWLMRQAGRYLPEYCATRAKAGSFMGLATNVDYATEVTLQPLERYPLDAAILFSDILTVPDAMGLGLSFAQGEGPRFEKQVRDEAAVAELAVPVALAETFHEASCRTRVGRVASSSATGFSIGVACAALWVGFSAGGAPEALVGASLQPVPPRNRRSRRQKTGAAGAP